MSYLRLWGISIGIGVIAYCAMGFTLPFAEAVSDPMPAHTYPKFVYNPLLPGMQALRPAKTVRIATASVDTFPLAGLGLEAETKLNNLLALPLQESGEPLATQAPCSCVAGKASIERDQTGNQGLFADELILISEGANEEWQISGPPLAPDSLPFAYLEQEEVELAQLQRLQIGTRLPLRGTVERDGNTYYIYSLPIYHQDSLGYRVTLQERSGAQPDTTIRIQNTCYYPDLQFDTLSDGFLTSDAPLTVNATIDAASEGAGRFLLLDSLGTSLAEEQGTTFELDPSALAPGAYTLQYQFDAGTATPEDPDDPGCTQTFVRNFRIVDPAFACTQALTIALGANCSAPITADQVLRGSGVATVADRYEIRVLYPDGSTSTDMVFGVGRYQYRVFGPNDFSCTGEVVTEDVSAPALLRTDFPDLDLLCSDLEQIRDNPETIDPNFAYYTGGVEFVDNCSQVNLTFFDEFIPGDCADPFYARIERTFVATDASGQLNSITQVLNFRRPALEEFTLQDTLSIHSCTPESVALPQRFPFLINSFGDTVRLNEVDCAYSLSTDEESFAGCGNSRKIERVYRAFDWCSGTTEEVDTLLIIIGDQKPASIQKTTDTLTISTGNFDCLASIGLDRSALQEQFQLELEDCSTLNLQARVVSYGQQLDQNGFPIGDIGWYDPDYMVSNGFASGIPVGLHAVVFTATDACTNSVSDSLFFRVADQVKPTPRCVDDLTISLGEPGFARLSAEAIDEGTDDNCGPVTLALRRTVSAACVSTFVENGYDQNGDGQLDAANGFTQENGLLYTPYAAAADFFCCDADQEIRVELRATDESGNQNTCWTEVLVEDKTAPQCLAPDAVTVGCSQPGLEDLTQFGEARVVEDLCGNISIEELSPVENLDQCGLGTITRRFQAVKYAGTAREQRSAICEQVITVVENNAYSICFPADARANCRLDTSIQGITITEDACDLLAITQEDQRFLATADPEACYKIFRTYSVINWCEYDNESDPVVVSRDWDNWNGTNPGRDNCDSPNYTDDNGGRPDGDDQPGDEGICVVVRKNLADGLPDTVYYDRDANPYNTVPDNPATDGVQEGFWWRVISGNNDPQTEAYYEGDCSVWGWDGNQLDSDISGNTSADDSDRRYGSFGYWIYTQHILVYDSVAPELMLIQPRDTFFSVDNRSCEGEVRLRLMVSDVCIDAAQDIQVKVDLDLFNDGTIDRSVSVDRSRFPEIRLLERVQLGQHRFEIRVDDGCGNEILREKTFTVIDAKAPSPICIQGLSTNLMPVSPIDSIGPGAVTISVSDFVASEVTDCSGPIEYSINRAGEDPDPDRKGMVLTCADEGTLLVEIYAWDQAGNRDFCETYVLISDFNDLCARTADIAGTIATEASVPVEGVDVSLSGIGECRAPTNENGTFGFNGLQKEYDYTVIPRSDRNYTNGISTFDLVLMQKHILGTDPLESPYKIIAADVNRSGAVSVLDMIQLRKIILRIDTRFSNNESWRFVDARYEFKNSQNPLAEVFPELINVNNLADDVLGLDFVAIKVGDVNLSASPSAFAQPRSGGVFDGIFPVNVEHVELQAGQQYEIPISSANWAAIMGLQFSLQLDPELASLFDIRAGAIGEEHMAIFPDAGRVNISWNDVSDRYPEESTTLFTLVLQARESVDLYEVLHLQPNVLSPEAYHRNGDLLELTLNSNERPGEELGLRLFQNQPNPVRSGTSIRFYLPESNVGSLRIHDVHGREVYRYEGLLNAGYQEVYIRREQLAGSGVLYYTLTVKEQQLTRRLLLVD